MAKKKQTEDIVAFIEDLKRQWMATVDALVDPLIIVDKDYKIKKANHAMATKSGQGVKQLIGEKCYKIVAGRDKPCSGCKMRQAADQKSAEQFELDQVHEEFFYEVTSQPVFDSNKNLDGVVQVYRDRTEAKKLREQLLQSEKLGSIGLLAGGIAHEINNPLGGILVFSQMLLREMEKDNPHRPDVEEILAATQRCKAIVENLLDFARTKSANAKNAEITSVNIVEAAKTALRFGKVGMKKHLVEIEENWSEEELIVKADRNKLIQVFLNLIQNAVQAMPDGGTLELKSYLDTKNKQGVCEIRDSGVGIPPNQINKIFDPFFTTKEPGEGTGLGLAIVYGIVKDFDGTLEVESAENEGTTFMVRLPIEENSLEETG